MTLPHGPGTVLADRYRLDERIGSGGMGEVWRATDLTLGRAVAVKLMRPGLLEDPGFRSRFLIEARAMASIDHPGVVAMHDYQDHPAGAFLVMAYVQGEALSHLLARVGPLSASHTMELVAQAGEALHAAHRKGIVHRDVKPANLLVRPDGTVALTDFGIARTQAGTQLTATGALLGTLSYLAPEQVLGDPATPRSDIYSLGVLAFECLTGSRPFDRDNPFATAMARVREAPPTLTAGTPAGVAAVMVRALATDPAQRWSSAAEFAAACRHAAHQPPERLPGAAMPSPGPAAPSAMPSPGPAAPSARPSPGPAAPTTPPPPGRRRPRRLALAVTGGAVGVATVVTGVVLALVVVDNLRGDDDLPSPPPRAGALPTEVADCQGTGLHIGTILPETGVLAFLGPPMVAGVEVALDDIDEAGGVLGECTRSTHTDSGDSGTDTAIQNAKALVQQGVHAIVGPASSLTVLQIIDTLYDAGVVQVSPSSSAVQLTTHPKGGYFFRTAPADTLQAPALAALIHQDGHERVAIVALDSPYGIGMLEHTRAAVEDGPGSVVREVVYDPQTPDFSSQAGQVAAADPDAVVLITFSELPALASALGRAGAGPDVTDWYLVDANLTDYQRELPAGYLAGVRGTLPGADPSPLQERMLAVDPTLTDFRYGPESYDAVILVALAATAAGSYQPDDIRDQLAAISAAPGTECRSYPECVELLAAGADIDYHGISGPIDWDDNGDLTAAYIGVHEYDEDNRHHHVDHQRADVVG